MSLVHTLRSAALWLMAAGGLCFVDAPLLTMGQAWTASRWRERNILLTIELTFYALWAYARFFLDLDHALLSTAAEPALALAGAAILAAGVVLAAWAKLRLGRWFSATFGVKEGHVLVTDGPYAVTRHPIYSGLIATIAGAALLWNSALTLLLAVLLAVPYFLHTVHEEALFEQHFGAAYRDYQRRVPRLVPFAPLSRR